MQIRNILVVFFAIAIITVSGGIVWQEFSKENDIIPSDNVLPVEPEEEKMTIIASGTCGENATWELDDQGVMTISGTIVDYDESYVEYKESIKKVVFNSGVTELKAGLFVEFLLEEIAVPDTLTTISTRSEFFSPFYDCPCLKKISYNALTQISYPLFASCGAQEEGISVILGDNVTAFPRALCHNGGYAFTYNSVKLGSGFTDFSNHGFCNIFELIYPTSDTSTTLEGVTVTFRNGPGSAFETEYVNDYAYVYSDSKIYVLGHKGPVSDLVLPAASDYPYSNVDQYLIKDYAFSSNQSIKTAKIPGIYKTSPNLSYCSQLYSVTLEEGVEIAGNATDCLSISEYVIPSTLTSISGSFDSLKSFTGSNTHLTEDGIFFISASGDINAVARDNSVFIIPEGVTSLGSNLFAYCKTVKKIVCPTTLQSIGNYCFRYSSLEEIEFNDTVRLMIGTSAFAHSNIKHLYIPKNVALPLNSGVGVFEDCRQLETVTIASEQINRLTRSSGFYQCINLEEVRITSNTILSIENLVFGRCFSLETIYLNNVASIQSGTGVNQATFYDCPSLKNVYFSENNSTLFFEDGAIYKIESGNLYAVWLCGAHPEIVIKAGTKDILGYYKSNLAHTISNICRIALPSSLSALSGYFYFPKLSEVADASGQTFVNHAIVLAPEHYYNPSQRQSYMFTYEEEGVTYWIYHDSTLSGNPYYMMSCDRLSGEISLPDRIVTPGNEIITSYYISPFFLHNYRITKLYTGGATSINNYGFGVETEFKDYYPVISEVRFGENIGSINEYAFIGRNIQSIMYSDQLVTISRYAFRFSNGMEYISLNNIRGIGTESFYRNIDLKTVIIGNNVSSVEPRAFSGCTSIEKIVIASESAPSLGLNCFDIGNDNRIVKVFTPNNWANDSTFGNLVRGNSNVVFQYIDLCEFKITFDHDGYYEVFDDSDPPVFQYAMPLNDVTRSEVIGNTVLSTQDHFLPNFPQSIAQPRFIFDGWFVMDPNDMETRTIDGQQVRVNVNPNWCSNPISSDTEFEKNTTLHAKWIPLPVENPSNVCYFERGYLARNEQGERVMRKTRIFMPVVKSIEDSITANLTQLDTVMYGFDNKFVCDMGTVRKLNVTFERVTPNDYDENDTYLEVGSDAQDENGTIHSLSQVMEVTNKMSNAKWFDLFLKFIDGWQNSNVTASGVRRGGFTFHFSPYHREVAPGIPVYDPLRTYWEMYPQLNLNVFIAGNISAKMDVNKLTFTVPMVVSAMRAETQTVVITWTSKFYKNESSDECVTINAPYGFPMDVPSPDPSWVAQYMKEGMVFRGWVGKGGSTLSGTVGEQIPFQTAYLDEEMEYYALWEEMDIMCVYTPNLGSSSDPFDFTTSSAVPTDDARYAYTLNPFTDPALAEYAAPFSSCKVTIMMYGGGGSGSTIYSPGIETIQVQNIVNETWNGEVWESNDNDNAVMKVLKWGFNHSAPASIYKAGSSTVKTVVTNRHNYNAKGGSGGGVDKNCTIGSTVIPKTGSYSLTINVGKGGVAPHLSDDGVAKCGNRGGVSGRNGEISKVGRFNGTEWEWVKKSGYGQGGVCGTDSLLAAGGETGGGAGGSAGDMGGTGKGPGAGSSTGGTGGLGKNQGGWPNNAYNGTARFGGGGGGGSLSKDSYGNTGVNIENASFVLVNGMRVNDESISFTSAGGNGASAGGRTSDYDAKLPKAGWEDADGVKKYWFGGGGGGGSAWYRTNTIDPWHINLVDNYASDGAPGLVILMLKYR